MKENELEQLLATEMEDIQGGAEDAGTCVCENGGAGAVVIITQPV
jgi:hypothetical protein